MRTGAMISGGLHAALVAAAVFGVDWFREQELTPFAVTEVQVIDEQDFAAALSTAPIVRSEGPADLAAPADDERAPEAPEARDHAVQLAEIRIPAAASDPPRADRPAIRREAPATPPPPPEPVMPQAVTAPPAPTEKPPVPPKPEPVAEPEPEPEPRQPEPPAPKAVAERPPEPRQPEPPAPVAVAERAPEPRKDPEIDARRIAKLLDDLDEPDPAPDPQVGGSRSEFALRLRPGELNALSLAIRKHYLYNGDVSDRSLQVVIRVRLNSDGTIFGRPERRSASGGNAASRNALFQAGKRALLKAEQAAEFRKLPVDRHSGWKVLNFRFSVDNVGGVS